MKYKIKQIKDIGKCDYAFEHYDWCKDKINLDDYEVVWEGDYAVGSNPNVRVENYLESIFIMFNNKHPEGYKGHSLSVSDIVELDGVNYFCDAFGWIKLED